METRPTAEAEDSWQAYLDRNGLDPNNGERRRLKRHRHDEKLDLVEVELERETAYLEENEKITEKSMLKAKRKHEKRMSKLYANPGISGSTVHGFMIDAGSTGSRLHLYEWNPRELSSHHEVQMAVSGRKLSFPASESRWTDRLRPGIATLATLPDDELVDGVLEYLSPLVEFAKTVLHEKQKTFSDFPIFLRATAGMRILSKTDRSRVLGAVRTVFNDKTFCPFYFEDEFARILSGEEEAVYGWAGINFILGSLIEESEGLGTVLNPKLTYGALDMGGASTQISFYEPQEDIMANLFKLQIGQGKHWNLYAHSFLYYGLNAARDRFHAKLLAGIDAETRLVEGVYNPCLPGGSRKDIRLDIHINDEGDETWEYDTSVSDTGFYQAIMKNDNDTSSFEDCLEHTRKILHLEQNSWCDFAHRGECAFNGVPMSELPTQNEHFGEFLAFSNYYHVWDFLGLPKRASIQELYDSTEKICSMSKDEIFEFNRNHARVDDELVEDFCFRSSYAFNVLRNGYGFDFDAHITATEVINGQKVGWAIGAMLYEINTLPWKYVGSNHKANDDTDTNVYMLHEHKLPHSTFIFVLLLGVMVSLVAMFSARRNRNRAYYNPIKDEAIRLNA